MTFQALYKATRLVYGNPESRIGIVTLWTKPKELAAKIEQNNYCVMGPLYSAERGLDLLVRNLLANPQITTLIMTGVDFSKSGVVLKDFFEKGFFLGKTDTAEKVCWRVNSAYEGYIGTDIPEKELNSIRHAITFVHAPNINETDFSAYEKSEQKESWQMREKKVYIRPEETTRQYVGDCVGYIVRGETVAECWLKALDTILKFGKENGTHYDDMQKEVLNLMSIVTGEDPYNLYIPDYMPSDRQHVMEYIPKITHDMPGGIHKNEYTYGSRMRSWFGDDQIKHSIAKLVREPVSRAVVISLWEPVKDLTIGGSPCLNHIWLRISDKKLYMTAIFRSHDMFEGYPDNLFGLRVLQDEIRKELYEKLMESGKEHDIKLGDLIILSQSAHIYDDSWERCQKIIDMHLPRYNTMMSQLDPGGNFIINAEDGMIKVEHTSPTRETIRNYTGKTADEIISRLISDNVISLVPHALDIGKELYKAEVALRLGKEYIQDNDNI